MAETSFHNGCTIVVLDNGKHACREHSVPVYRDGIDWAVDTTPEP